MTAFAEKMYEFQKEYNITKECIFNCKVYVDILKSINRNPKFKAVMVLGHYSDDTLYINGGHFVVDLDGNFHEVSYDVNKIKERHYFDNIKQVLENIDKFKNLQVSKKDIIDNFIKFKKIEKCLNDDTYGFNEYEKFICNLQKDYCLNKIKN